MDSFKKYQLRVSGEYVHLSHTTGSGRVAEIYEEIKARPIGSAIVAAYAKMVNFLEMEKAA